ncbi:hypothetical protein L1D14_07465 [Vibrio tubiashii]|uniref:hypothetical protein n=1 Tax=Vibrio tubiashii TaxID=29498 RepID=UPI001EFCD171|nr:hypothetical protein [Vibrio tubiashii]MCG9576076.1 hypothetical protein [Vibrio tubiashii]
MESLMQSYSIGLHFLIGVLMWSVYYSYATYIKHFGSEEQKQKLTESLSSITEQMDMIRSKTGGGAGYPLSLSINACLLIATWPVSVANLLLKSIGLKKAV